MKLLLLTGVAGAGKSTVCHAFEERGYRIVENVPLGALDAMVDACLPDVEYAKTVLTVGLGEAAKALEILRSREGLDVIFMVLDCTHDQLLARFRLTRHVHPLQSKGMTLDEAIKADAIAIDAIRPLADIYIDTTGWEAASLREVTLGEVEGTHGNDLVVRFLSFGYKFGVPRDAEIVFDCRHVPNPYWVKELRRFTGLDNEIIEWLEARPQTDEAFEAMTQYLSYFLQKARKDRRNFVSVSLGCSGGQHRSVYFAERLAKYFSKDYATFVTHREMARYREE